MSTPLSVAVITSTIGRPELARAIESVAAQTYPCTHYIFVDGTQYATSAREIVQHYPHLKVIFLPNNTGANGWYNSHINAAASFIAQEDVICFLDDDNWYRLDHIASLVEVLEQQNADYAYSLRNFIDTHNQFICRDDYASLGEWARKFYQQSVEIELSVHGKTFKTTTTGFNYEHLIDVNCLALRRDLAREIAATWCTVGMGNDIMVTRKLRELGKRAAHTGQYSVNYCLDYAKSEISKDMYTAFSAQYNEENTREILRTWLQTLNQVHVNVYGGTPWAKE